jgi:hypothetical protein
LHCRSLRCSSIGPLKDQLKGEKQFQVKLNFGTSNRRWMDYLGFTSIFGKNQTRIFALLAYGIRDNSHESGYYRAGIFLG